MKNTKIILCAAMLMGTTAMAQQLLPMPQHVEWGKGNFSTNKPLVIQKTANVKGLQQMDWKMLGETVTNDENKNQRCLVLTDLKGKKSNEAYRLRVVRDTVEIAATSLAGFVYAQATLQQLAHEGNIPCCVIEDEPAYAWRGAMIDVSRHFFPISFLKRQIDVMASFKMNRLHLHLTDAAGWRMEIKRYPRLTNFAAWRPQASWKTWWNNDRKYCHEGEEGAYGGYYTQDQLRDLVKYAEQRGITIIPEIEMPAHSEEVLAAYPELSCTHVPYKQADFCPGNVGTYDFLEHVLEEVMDVFPSRYIHIGGDEAGKQSWASCTLCQQKMKEEYIKSFDQLQSHLVRHMGEFLEHHGRRMMGWDEIIDSDFAEGTTVMVWRNRKHAQRAISMGYDVVMSPTSNCYLDYYQDAPHLQPEAIGGFLTLEKVYNFIPEEGMTTEQLSHVKGVQGNLWTEYVPTEAHAEYMLYPRLLALAEIGWNGTKEKDYEDFRQRAVTMTDRLREQGINAFDLHKEIGDRPESLKLLKHKAYGKKVTYNKPFSPYYPANNEATLTDGIRGGWSHGDGRWQGFIGRSCFDVVIDLGEVQRIKSVGTEFMQSSGAEIFFPGRYEISVSFDGQHFKPLYELTRDVNKLPQYKSEVWRWEGKATGRYIRVEARTGKMGGWIFADEIEVE